MKFISQDKLRLVKHNADQETSSIFCFTEFEKLLEKDIWSSPNFHEMEKVAAICTFSYFCPLKED